MSACINRLKSALATQGIAVETVRQISRPAALEAYQARFQAGSPQAYGYLHISLAPNDAPDSIRIRAIDDAGVLLVDHLLRMGRPLEDMTYEELEQTVEARKENFALFSTTLLSTLHQSELTLA